MESIENYPMESDEKTFGNKTPLLPTKPKDEWSQDLEGMVKMMQKLSNRVIDLEKEKEAHKPYKPYYKKGKTIVNLNLLHTVLQRWI